MFGWHIGRKLFLRACAELGITSWNAQMMCGKAVDKSIATYINGVQLKNDAKKVHNVLRMELVAPSTSSDDQKTLDVVMETLRALMEDKLKEKGLLKKTKSVNWLELLEKLKPESERREKVPID